jgi:hypothetical protein
MAWVFVVLTVVLVVAVGLVAVGRVSAELANRPMVSVFDLDEAVEYVADRLRSDTAGQLSYDEVRALLDWHLSYFESRGVADEHDPLASLAARDEPERDAVVMTDDDGGVAYVLGKATEAGLEVADVQVVEVLDLQMQYLRAIGAIGAAADDPRGGAPDVNPV